MSKYQLVGTESVEVQAGPASIPAPNPPPQINLAPMLTALRLGVMVLSARALLLLALIGAFFLGWDAVQSPDPWRLGASALFFILVFLPLAALSAVKG